MGNDGGPAYPCGSYHPGTGAPQPPVYSGKSLRDWFAGMATEEDVLAWVGIMGMNNVPITREEAKYAYADAMLRARKASGTAEEDSNGPT